jgi:hypothetical protein
MLKNEDKNIEIEVDLGDGRMRGHPNTINRYLAAREAARARNARWPQTPEGHVDTVAAMTTLARSFPSLRDADGIEPWDLERFARWLCTGTSGGGRRAGRFVLYVWSPRTDHREFGRALEIEHADDGALDPFDLSDALSVWDEEHKRAFVSWVEAPFWP